MRGLKALKIVRALSALGAVLLGAVTVLLFVGMLLSVPDTLKHDQEINSAFSRTASWVEEFNSNKGRLPSKAELEGWYAAQDRSFWLKSIELISNPAHFPDETIKTFGAAPTGGYLLGLWRGEWNEYYASWTKTSTIGNAKDAILFVLQWAAISFLLFVLCFFMWRFRRPTGRSKGRAASGAPLS